MSTMTTIKKSATTTKPCKALLLNEDGTGGYGVLKDSDLSTLQALVGGFIEKMEIGHGVHAYFDEDGRSKRLGLNIGASLIVTIVREGEPIFLVGPVVFLGDGPDGTEGDLPDGFAEFALTLLGAVPDEEDES